MTSGIKIPFNYYCLGSLYFVLSLRSARGGEAISLLIL